MRRVFLEVVNYDLHVTELQYGSWINDLEQISAHVSSILVYKTSGFVNPQQPILVSQSLLKQPPITLSPGYVPNHYEHYNRYEQQYDHHSPEYQLTPSLYYAPVSRVHRLSW